ncbi:MAG: TIGR00295 family protein [Archaeoglobaceae archaeon]|nr:TIGR00295 family protein [Archaeoglobaceae archaeon]MDW8117983.1 TIGR00295 family protein [Archaeoglobaceae archaeon]
MDVPEIVKMLWDKYGLQENVRKHCIAVANLAIKIVERMERNGLKLDKKAVLLGALFHDIGRAITHDPFQHFLESAEILRAERVDERVVKIAERHFSAGITAEEAKKLGLPERDYLPETLEEKIVSFADNITFGAKNVDFESFMRRLDKIDLENPNLKWFTEATRKRAREMKEEIEKLSGMKF